MFNPKNKQSNKPPKDNPTHGSASLLGASGTGVNHSLYSSTTAGYDWHYFIKNNKEGTAHFTPLLYQIHSEPKNMFVTTPPGLKTFSHRVRNKSISHKNNEK